MHLLTLIERFLRASGMPPTRFGQEAMHDPRFVFDLRKGREPGGSTVRRVCDFIAAWDTSRKHDGGIAC